MVLMLRPPNVCCLLIVLICFLFSILSDTVSANSIEKQVDDRFRHWEDEDEYVDHDYYKRKRDRQERRRKKEHLDREIELVREKEREFQSEKTHNDLLEKLLKSDNIDYQPVAVMSAVTASPQISPVATAVPIPSQIQAPPMSHQAEIPPQLVQNLATDSNGHGRNDWLSNIDGVNNEIYASTNLGGGIFDSNDFASPLISQGNNDWKELAHWYREQNWNFEKQNTLGPHSWRPPYKHFRKPHKGVKISGVKEGLLKAKITALYVKKLGIAFLVALLAPLVVITVIGPFLTALSLVSLNSQAWGHSPIANQPQRWQLAENQLKHKVNLFQIPGNGTERTRRKFAILHNLESWRRPNTTTSKEHMTDIAFKIQEGLSRH